jgi:hypothetical protein
MRYVDEVQVLQRTAAILISIEVRNGDFAKHANDSLA